ncbi:MAG: ribonuclease Z [Planctomycetota bacterium]|nr:ribonuclease Z [Planctomycetota bacterium]
MNVHFLGTAGYHPGERRQTSCVFLPEAGVMFDAGTGIFRATPLIAKESLHIFLSHAHLDHVFGLTCLLDIVPKTILKKVYVYAEQAKIDAIRNGMLHPLLFPAELPVEWVSLESLGDSLTLNDAVVRWFPLTHPGGSVGYRMDWEDLSLAYVTDTTADDTSPYWNEVREVDWLIHECNFCDSEIEFARMTGHSWTSAVLKGAKKARVQRLVMTHLQPLSENADPVDLAGSLAKHRDLGPDQIILADDLLCIEL